MKQKILNALKTEYANLGLSDKALNGVASFLEKTITDESGIGAAIKEATVADLLKIYQSEIDSERGKASKAAKDLDDYKKAHPSGKTDDDSSKHGANDEVLALIKQMKADNDALKARLDAKDKETKTASTLASVRAALKNGRRDNEAVIDSILKGITINDDDTVEALTQKYEGEYDAAYKRFYGDGVVPASGGYRKPEGYKKGQFAGVVANLQQSGVLDKPSE